MEKKEIKEILKNHPEGLSIGEMMKKSGLSNEKVLEELKKLEQKGLLGNSELKSSKEKEILSKKIPLDPQNIKNEIERDLENKKIKNEEKKVESGKIFKKKLVKKEKIPSDALKINDEIKEDDNLIKEKATMGNRSKLPSEIREKATIGNRSKLPSEIREKESQILEQRSPVKHIINKIDDKSKAKSKKYFLTGVPGFDTLLGKGIPEGSSVIIAGGAGSGKTIFCTQALKNAVEKGKKCFYMSFEESEERLISHMEDFGWDPKKLIKSGHLLIKRYSPFEITRSVEALLAKEKGELLIDIDPIILPKGCDPDFIVLDSLTAIASAFSGKEDSYRIYIEKLFRFFEKLKSTSFLITETKQIPEIFSTTGVEEFLADGVIVLYSIRKENVRENAIEVLKLRGVSHQKRVVVMQITDRGVKVYPDQEILGGIS